MTRFVFTGHSYVYLNGLTQAELAVIYVPTLFALVCECIINGLISPQISKAIIVRLFFMSVSAGLAFLWFNALVLQFPLMIVFAIITATGIPLGRFYVYLSLLKTS